MHLDSTNDATSTGCLISENSLPQKLNVWHNTPRFGRLAQG